MITNPVARYLTHLEPYHSGGQKSRWAQLGSLLRVSHGQSQGVHQTGPAALGRITASRIRVIGRIQFLSVVGLFLSGCQPGITVSGLPQILAMWPPHNVAAYFLTASRRLSFPGVLCCILLLYNCNHGSDYPITFFL